MKRGIVPVAWQVHNSEGEWGYTDFRFSQGALFANSSSFDAELGWIPEQGVQRPWGTTVTILENGIRSNGRGEFWTDGLTTPSSQSEIPTPSAIVSDWETWPAQPALSELKAEDPSRYHRLYFPNDGHMTAEGNQFVAREILPILTER
jgi:hypothetical protein